MMRAIRIQRVVLFSVLCAASLTAISSAMAGKGAASKVWPADSTPHGLSYAEWSARHWQWMFSMPVDQHPIFDTADCSEGQSGNVWFLGGTFAVVDVRGGVILGEADRTCTIPSGTALFFPLVNVEASEIEGNGETQQELRDLANFLADFIDPASVFVEINGHDVAGLEDFRVESPLFTLGPLPENNVLQFFGVAAPEGATSPSVSDGYWAMVKPLPVGTHELHFGGVLDLSSVGGPIFIQDIRYTIEVVPRGRYEQ